MNNGKSYTHKPEIVYAFRYGFDPVPDWFTDYEKDGFGRIGMIYIWHGDWFNTMSTAEFESTYQLL